jgi:MFS family permease
MNHVAPGDEHGSPRDERGMRRDELDRMADQPAPRAAHDSYAALRLHDFRLFLVGNLLAILGVQMQTVAVGWEIYERTGKKLDLGLVGLVQFLPVALLTLPAGQVADRFNRKRILMTGMFSMAVCSLGLAVVSLTHGHVAWIYICLFVSGTARAFLQPAKASFVPQIVPRDMFANAVSWNMGVFQLAATIGPAIGGLMIGWLGGAMWVYVGDALATLTFVGLLASISSRQATPLSEAVSLASLLAGVAFVWRQKLILAAMTLDMFAVLLGGATMLLPVYAKDILDVGPTGLGALRAAPAIGALIMSLVLTHRPPFERAGRALIWAVVGFGVATIVFGFSRMVWLSMAMLFLTGAFDIVSVVIRHTLVQLLTPDAMRGRVSAVNSIFIGASNELGGFESGLVAQLTSPVISVVSGGIGTLLVVAAVVVGWPQLRRYGRLDGT